MEEQTTALTLPDEAQFRRDITAINKFQQTVHACMIKDSDYGVIPGTTKPTLLKPGAEKIAKLLGLADTYEILDKAEEWKLPFFRYLVKCKLVHVGMNVVISEGMGECNSMESKYRWRWVSERDLPENVDRNNLVTQERKSKTGGHWTVYRLDNDDIYSQVNTILKMAKKRALVDAALSAGRLSDVFTQDIEDIPSMAQQDFTTEKPADRARTEPDKSQHYCQVHDTPFFMKGKMKAYAHPIDGTDPVEWCHEHTPQAVTPQSSGVEEQPSPIDLTWLKEALDKIEASGVEKWSKKEVLARLNVTVNGEHKKISDAVRQLSAEQAADFASEVADMLKMV